MKTWVKFILFIILGFSSMVVMATAILFFFAPEDIKANIFAGVTCLICGVFGFMWSVYKEVNLDKW